jgi:precorrin-4 methylase
MHCHQYTSFEIQIPQAAMSTHDIRSGLDLKQFESADQAIFSTSGSGHLIIDQELARQGIRRRVAPTIPNFLGAACVIERTDLPTTIPRRLAELLRGRGEFSVFPLPFPIPEYAVK